MSWEGESAQRLEELFEAHRRIGGTGPGRRYATKQIDASLILQLAAHFQLFCRDLHSEAADALVAAAPKGYQAVLAITLTERRKLDTGNASDSSIRQDFARFGADIRAESESARSLTAIRRRRLSQLMIWRNAIAHQDFTFTSQQRKILDDTSITLGSFRAWRGACNGLAQTFDKVVAARIIAITES